MYYVCLVRFKHKQRTKNYSQAKTSRDYLTLVRITINLAIFLLLFKILNTMQNIQKQWYFLFIQFDYKLLVFYFFSELLHPFWTDLVWVSTVSLKCTKFFNILLASSIFKFNVYETSLIPYSVIYACYFLRIKIWVMADLFFPWILFKIFYSSSFIYGDISKRGQKSILCQFLF